MFVKIVKKKYHFVMQVLARILLLAKLKNVLNVQVISIYLMINRVVVIVAALGVNFNYN